ncbi:hypothetical protein MPER_08831, partial [Moniliophthora perniciosa FA553]
STDKPETVNMGTSPDPPSRSSPRVQFATPEKIERDSELADMAHTFSLNTDEHVFARSPSDSSSELSGTSTPTDFTSPTSPVAKAVASKLSFWSRLSKRNSLFPTTPEEERSKPEQKDTQEPIVSSAKVDSMINETMDKQEEPRQVLESILSETAPPPETTEEKHSELETKIIRECIREFVKGGMYFAYHFDITRSLQHKQEQVAKLRKQDALLADLNALPKSAQRGPAIEEEGWIH